jgi:hypothetical protein
MKAGYLKVFCDGCGDDVELEMDKREMNFYSPVRAIRRLKENYGWHSDGERDFCPTCIARNAMSPTP